MEPLTTTAVVAAISAAIAPGAKEVANSAVKDCYAAIKGMLAERFGSKSEAATALAQLETNSESEGQRLLLKEKLDNSRLVDEASFQELVNELVKALQASDAGTIAYEQFLNQGSDQQIGIQGNNATVHGGINFGKK